MAECMIEELESLKTDAIEEVTRCATLEELQAVETRFLGKKGSLTQILKTLGKQPPEERKKIGALSNKIKQEISAAISERDEVLSDALESARRSMAKIKEMGL